MFYLIQSNRMENLSQQLAELLSTPSQGQSVLQPEQILVQSPGMSTWLRLEVAKHNSIAAAIDFPLPSSFVWQLCHDLLPNVPKENAFTKAMMTWKLMTLLPNLIDSPEFTPLKAYLEKSIESETAASVKSYQLCNRIADIFDQYLVYRPDWILEWEQNEAPIKLSDEQAWQPILWRQLIEFNDQVLEQSHYHRANLHQDLLTSLSNLQSAPANIPNRLFVFGISSMPPQLLEILYHLSQSVDVYMFNLSPCQHYWGDILDPKLRARMAVKFSEKQQLAEHWEDKLEVGNPILANNGKMGRELLDLILALPEAHINLDPEDYFSPLNEAKPKLLHGIQHDILEMETLGEPLGPDANLYQNPEQRRVLGKNDNSVQLVSCHSPLRELETLHDYLLSQLEADPELKPKDIVVMLPDVASYAPYIDAVFSSKKGDHYIPYAIADRGAAQESPLVNSFLSLLTINISRYAVSDILATLEVPAIARRFNIDNDELQRIKRWVNEAGIRWGRDEQNREQIGVPAFEHNSWKFGLRRLLLGYALSDDSPLYHNTLKVEGIEGMEAQALGKLMSFIETIDEYHERFSQDATADERLQQLESLVDDIYTITNDERAQLQEIRDSIAKLKTELSDASFYNALPVQVLQNWFTSCLTESKVGQRYLAGSLNFCTLMPMRSIPFKYVCLLGMNDGVYPRNQHPIGFDLMAQFGARKGDRSRRLDDRYLFLEALLSARQQLYISYIGASERDNSERIPSMLISELMEYCELCYQTADGNSIKPELVKTQPLQPFDEKLYQFTIHSKHIQSYDEQWCPPINKQDSNSFCSVTTSIENDNDDLTEIDISALVRFYRNPAQNFFNRTLNLDLGLHVQEDENDEPFKLNALERYLLQDTLIKTAIDNGIEDIDDGITAQLKATGELPVAPFDQLLIDQYQHDIAPIIGRAVYLKGETQATTKDIDLTLDSGIKLVGRIDDVSPKGLVGVRPGRAHGRDFIRHYIRHLAINAMGTKKHSFLLDIGHYHALAPMKKDDAKAQLEVLVNHYFSGLKKPFKFLPKTSFAYATEDGSHDDKMLAAQKQWLDEQSQLGEGVEPHFQRVFTFPEDFSADDFGQIATQIWNPMINIYHSDTLAELKAFVEAEVLV
ncbi:exodeoxyribonuclease V subunit gamma [Shewanella sp. 202IG2-18]|uniref:exodeoxyribonuclease V subunit gamma n=1 Tax=Parashewanella hymeniacidonis TaxID=2807618 RepID=UPI0019613C1E|nr:exodeoxyribonuclease V subunit gamma [Parashewanella hymeniacidonis]MBM7072885.1 exodeoxyribonuclease V subunit gamma [Parashewanella hymeniacidonis]